MMAADYDERVARNCQHCGEDPADCTHRTTWENQSKPMAILITKKGPRDWGVAVWHSTGGRNIPVSSRKEALKKARDFIIEDDWALPDCSIDQVDIVARNCSYSREELKGTRTLDQVMNA